MADGSQNSAALRRIRGRMRAIEARREMLIMDLMDQPDAALLRGGDLASLAPLFAEDDRLRGEYALQLSRLRTALRQHDIERLARIGQASRPKDGAQRQRPGLIGQVSARIAAMLTIGAARA